MTLSNEKPRLDGRFALHPKVQGIFSFPLLLHHYTL